MLTAKLGGFDDGSTAVEYAIMMALVLVVCVTTITSSGSNVETQPMEVTTASN